MPDAEQPRLYLVTPPVFDQLTFPDRLSRVLDSRAVACLRLALSVSAEDEAARAADLLRPLCHERDIPVVIESHFRLVGRLGLDGVHLTDGARSVRTVRKELGAEAIVGAHCGASRHSGLNAGEAGADYVSFGPVGDSPLGAGETAGRELFAWWSEMVELPVVAEGALDPGLVEALAPVVDFFAIGPEIWGEDDPAAALARLTAALD